LTLANSALTYSKGKGAFYFLLGAKAKQHLKLVSIFLLIVLLMMQLGSKAYAQNTLDQLGLTAATPSLGAYSLRRLSSTYVGPAIAVLRSSDLSVSNIGFLPSGVLDTATLFSFIGSGNGTVQVWYDQSGFGRNLTQATATLQPRIVSSGEPLRDLNGNITLRFDGIDDHMTGTMSTGLLNVSLNMVARFNSGGNSEDIPFVIGQGGTARTIRAFYRTNNGPSLGYGTWSNDAPTSAHRLFTDSEPHIFSVLQNGTSITLSKNGANDIRTVPLAPLATTSALIQIGSISSDILKPWHLVQY
jgi:hypothetical protein